MAVNSELQAMGVSPLKTVLGEVLLNRELSADERKVLEQRLSQLGFELIDDRKKRLVEKIKNVIIDAVHYRDGALRQNLSEVLSNELNHDYTYLSNLFSDMEGTTIEKYLIAQKIERVKELLLYNELSLSEIAYHLNYSSVSYLSNQFKKITGKTPSQFKHGSPEQRKPLDKV